MTKVVSIKVAPSKKGAPKMDVQDIQNFLNSCGEYRYNVTLNRIEVRWSEGCVPDGSNAKEGVWTKLSEIDVNELWRQMSLVADPPKLSIVQNILGSHFCKQYYPLRDYILSLPEWDGHDYIRDIVDAITLKDNSPENRAYFYWTFTKWLVNMIASWMEDWLKNEYVFIIIGPQGCYKTTFFLYLLPRELDDYRLDRFNVNHVTKDDLISMATNGLINIDDVSGLKPSQMGDIKNLTSLTVINLRRPYAKNAESMPRNASFAATSNNIQMLADPNGEERRFLVHEVKVLPSFLTSPPNYTGLYSQVYALYQQSEDNYRFSAEEMATVNEKNKQFRIVNEAEEMIQQYFSVPVVGESQEVVSATEIVSRIAILAKIQLKAIEVGRAMTALGFPVVKRHGNKGYRVHQLSDDEIKKASDDCILEIAKEEQAAREAILPKEQSLPLDIDPFENGILPEV